MTIRTPYRDLYLTAGYDRTYYLTFVEDSAFVPPPLYTFPAGTNFRFRAKGTGADISKSSADGITYNPHEKRVEINFYPSNTASINKETVVPFEFDCIFPDGKRYLLLKGMLNIEKTMALLP